MVSNQGLAQFSISKVPSEADTRLKKDSVKPISAVSNEFFSEARFRAEKRRLRKERNTLTCTVGLNLNQTKFDNWAPGGVNTFSGVASLLFNHVYQRDRLRLATRLDSKYGMNVISGKTFKNIDYFILNVNSAWNISRCWAYSASVALPSQWTKGFRSADDKTMVSNIMSPGTLALGVGFTFRALKKDNTACKVPIVITVNPLSGSMTFVLSDTLSKQGVAGVEPGKHQKSALGSTMRIDLNQPIAKSKLNYITYFYVSTNYEKNNYVEWQNTLNIKITQIINASAFCRMIYNEVQPTPRNKPLQWNYTFGLGVAYTFKNK